MHPGFPLQLTCVRAEDTLEGEDCPVGRPRRLRIRMLRALVFLLAGWPLLLPQGMCICRFIRAGDVSPRSTEAQVKNGQEDSCSDPCCDECKANCGPFCGTGQGGPTDNQCPPVCPANKKADHSRLLEHQHPLGATVLAATPLPFFLALSAGQQLHGLHVPAQASHPPIYLSLCTLLI